MLNREFEIFKKLNDELKKEKLFMKIICVGGFVLNHYGMRATQDIDGFYKTSENIEKIIKAVGDEFDINKPNELWLNNSAQNFNNEPPEEICDKLYVFSNLLVLMPPLDYVAGMKLRSAREIDIMDVADIIRKEKVISPIEFQKRLNSYGFTNIDISLLLEAFGNAYGIKWLEEYYIAHESELFS